MGEIASHKQLRMSFLRWALVTVPAVVLLGFASAKLAGSSENDRWFEALAKPAAMPDGWVFGVAWTVFYVLLGLALALVLNARGAGGRPIAIALFVGQLVLNLLWSPLFFGAHQVTAALFVILATLLLALIVTVLFARIRTLAGWLLVPYLAWLCFAAALNWDIVRLNPGAETLAPAAPGTQIAL